jgi:hypothetical protein
MKSPSTRVEKVTDGGWKSRIHMKEKPSLLDALTATMKWFVLVTCPTVGGGHISA